MRQIRLIIGALVLVSPFAAAMPIHYDESVSGDLVNGLPYDLTKNIGTLGIGANTVTGNLTGPLFADASDEFNFYIADDTRLLNVIFEFSDVVSYSSLTVFIRKIIDPTLPTVEFDEPARIEMGTDSSPVRVFRPVLPLGAGLYQISTPGSFSFSDSDFLNLDYRWRLVVVPVPEPSTLVLLSMGLFGMGLARRKRAVSP